jgi:hypothetical protein
MKFILFPLNRWLNQMAQKLGVGATVSDQGEVDQRNRRAFEYFTWLIDPGMLPFDVVKQQLRTFGEKVLARYK